VRKASTVTRSRKASTVTKSRDGSTVTESGLNGGAALQINDLSYSYDGIAALRSVSVDVAPGTVCCVLGPNGAGKTTLGGCVAGLLRTGRGSVVFDGVDISEEPLHHRARRGLAYVPGGGDIFPALTVADNLMIGAPSVSRAARREMIEEAEQIFPVVASRQNSLAGMLSGGEQQMVSLARILVTEPRLAVIDELSHGLAPAIVDQLFRTLATRKGNTTFLLIEQYLQRSYALADTLLVLSRGEVTYSGSTSAASRAEIEASYLGDGDQTSGHVPTPIPGVVTQAPAQADPPAEADAAAAAHVPNHEAT
jgi:branched-chain amino acid transport system ATP-binding protein